MEHNVNCPSCGRGLFAGDAYCSSCGTPVGDRTPESGAERRSHATQNVDTSQRQNCASCNSPLLPDDSFCATCGARQDVGAPVTYVAPSDDVPTRLVAATQGKYEFIRELGHGGMGNVFLARDLTLDRLDAIKVLKPSMLADAEMVERFRREARTIANLRHESIVAVYGVGEAGGLHYFIMDYIDGTSLSQVLRQVGRLSIQTVEAILYQVGSALSYAHQAQSVVHRDVKPSNIMLTRRGRAIVTDFGIAKVSEVQGGLTRTGVLMGTPEYMSPEQCRESTVTHHTDQYALGAVTFAMLTGAPPFTGQWLQVAAAHQTQPTPSIKEARPDCPDELAEAVERMLSKLPADRWPDIRDALKHLKLRPLPVDDPALVEIAGIVEQTQAAEEAKVTLASQPTVPSRTPTNLRIAAPIDEIETGDVLQLEASMVFDDGAEIEGSDITWGSTNPSIASVDPNTGELAAHAVGSAQITARSGNLAGTLAVGVVPPRVAQLEIQPQGIALEVGQSFQLRADARSKRGEILERGISWSSSDPHSVRVSDSGIVRALKPGRGTVLAHCEGTGASTTVTVVTGAQAPYEAPHTPVTGSSATMAQPTPATGMPVTTGPPTVSRINVSKPPEPLRVSEVFSLTATAVTAAGETVDRQVSWRVSDPTVVEELGPGQFLVVGNGSTTITAEAEGVTGGVSLRVGDPAPKKAAVPVWRRPAVVAGVLIVAAAGVSAPFMFGGGDSEGEASAPPVGPTVTDLQIVDGRTGDGVEDGIQLAPGESLSLAASMTDQNGNPLNRPVEWTSSNPSIGTIDTGGVLIAQAGGNTTITATVAGLTRSVPVTVSVPVTRMAIVGANGNEVSNLILYVGQSQTLRARVLDGSGAELERNVQWASANPSVADISGTGLVRALGIGSAQVTASAGGAQGTVSASVLAPPPVRVQISIRPTFAALFVDSEPAGEGRRLYEIELTPGEHRILLQNPNFESYVQTVQISLLQPDTVIDVELVPRNDR